MSASTPPASPKFRCRRVAGFRLFARRPASRAGYAGRDRGHCRQAQARRAVSGLSLLCPRQSPGLVSRAVADQQSRRVLSSRGCRIRFGFAVSQTIAALVYWPLARRRGCCRGSACSARSLPLSYYADKSFYVMRTDAYDRFCTRLEKRFTRREIERDAAACRFRRYADFRIASRSGAPSASRRRAQ